MFTPPPMFPKQMNDSIANEYRHLDVWALQNLSLKWIPKPYGTP